MSRYRSKQTQELQRRLAMRLVAAWAAFTVAFACVALLLNATVVPSLANLIADSTSGWYYWYYEDYPLGDCLSILGEEVVDAAPVPSVEEELLAQGLEAANAGEASDGQDVAIALEDIRKAAAVAGEGEDGSPGPLYLVEGPEGQLAWMTERQLQSAAIHQQMALMQASGGDWAIEEGEEFIAARNLATYHVLRDMKLPLAAVAYLLGCVGLAFMTLGRSLRSFDDLSGAVAGLMADRERPVELPSELALTQDELNAIRLASLADERAAQAAERRKDELVAYLAHDVRTPLTSVIGYLALLDEAPDMPEATRERYTRSALEKAERLEGLVEEFFEITRYNLQAIPIERSRVSVRLFCEQVAEELYPAAEERGCSIMVQAPDQGGFLVDGDKLARALGNVVRNAVAYADEGTPILVAAKEMEPSQGEGPWWELTVENQGREISEAHLQAIFDKFYREEGARSTGQGRAGLGLAIAKEIVSAHGGTIGAASSEGRTTFTIKVPA